MHVGFGSTQEGTSGSLSRKCIFFQRTGAGCSIKVHDHYNACNPCFCCPTFLVHTIAPNFGIKPDEMLLMLKE